MALGPSCLCTEYQSQHNSKYLRDECCYVVAGDGGCDLAGTNEGLLNHIIIIISIVATQLKPVENISVSHQALIRFKLERVNQLSNCTLFSLWFSSLESLRKCPHP